MNFDILIRNAVLSDAKRYDIAIKDGLFVAIEPHLDLALDQQSEHVLDAQSFLLTPPFVDAHFHLDATLSVGAPRFNQSGTLLEGIQIWSEQKPQLTAEQIYQRAYQMVLWAVARGTLYMRSHVDICDPSLKALRVLKQVQKDVSSFFHLQLVAFPQDGYLRDPLAKKLMQDAIDLGVEVIGGIPHFELCTQEGRESLKQLTRLSADHGLLMDIHCDETDDTQSRFVLDLAAQSIRYGLQGRITASHVTSLHSMPNGARQHTLGVLAEANMHIVANPLINITLQGRSDSYPKRRGMAPVPELLQAGLKVAFGHDCVMDPWYALGSADMLDVAHMGLHVAHMTGIAQMHDCFKAITDMPAHILGYHDYGIKVGHPAHCVLLYARDPVEALRIKAQRAWVISHGRCIASSPQAKVSLTLPQSPAQEITFLEAPSYPLP